jgi:nucleotide-binding universal stress UspA family protein
MYKRILVPVDGSRTSARGLEEAIKLAKSQKASLVVLHIVDDAILTSSEIVPVYMEEIIKSLRKGGERILARAAAKVRARGVKPKPVLVEKFGGLVADVIIAQARKQRAGLIVLGTHGRRGVTRLVMGSDAEGVVRRTPVPVLLVRK